MGKRSGIHIIKLLLLSSLFLCDIQLLMGQFKYEKEYRLKERFVPKTALSFIDAFHFEGKIKWYREEGLNSHSIEAKTIANGQTFSIEFDTLGVIEDIEITIKSTEIPPNTLAAIETYLKTSYQDHKYLKCQIQYTGAPKALSSLSTSFPSSSTEDIQINYELIVHVKAAKDDHQMEFLFDEHGNVLKALEIILKNSDTLEY